MSIKRTVPAAERLTAEADQSHAGERLDRFLSELMPSLSRARVQALIKQGHAEEAIKHLRRAIELMPELYPAHFNLGTALLNQHDLGAAKRCFEQAVALAPNFAQAHKRGRAVPLAMPAPVAK